MDGSCPTFASAKGVNNYGKYVASDIQQLDRLQ